MRAPSIVCGMIAKCGIRNWECGMIPVNAHSEFRIPHSEFGMVVFD